jgi:hypothetical protein
MLICQIINGHIGFVYFGTSIAITDIDIIKNVFIGFIFTGAGI